MLDYWQVFQDHSMFAVCSSFLRLFFASFGLCSLKSSFKLFGTKALMNVTVVLRTYSLQHHHIWNLLFATRTYMEDLDRKLCTCILTRLTGYFWPARSISPYPESLPNASFTFLSFHRQNGLDNRARQAGKYSEQTLSNKVGRGN